MTAKVINMAEFERQRRARPLAMALQSYINATDDLGAALRHFGAVKGARRAERVVSEQFPVVINAVGAVLIRVYQGGDP
jgi:hypothetical protein